MTGQDPVRLLLDKIDAREQALAREAEQARTLIDDLTARLRELDEAIDHLRITRKTLLSLAGEPATEPAASRAARPSRLPADPGRLRRCRPSPCGHATCARPWTCPSCPSNTENIRHGQTMVSRRTLVNTEPGLVTQPHP